MEIDAQGYFGKQPLKVRRWILIFAKRLEVPAGRKHSIQIYSEVFGFGKNWHGFPIKVYLIKLTFGYLMMDVWGAGIVLIVLSFNFHIWRYAAGVTTFLDRTSPLLTATFHQHA